MNAQIPRPPPSRVTRSLKAALLLASLAACKEPAPIDEEPDAGVVPDLCNSRDEAASGEACALVQGEVKGGHISFAADEDWYRINAPATLTPRSILHVSGGYAVPATPVSLTLNLLREDGLTSLLRKVDRPGQGAPKALDLILPFSTANAILFLKVSDEQTNPTRPAFDVRAPYQLSVEVLENPDNNEPNDFIPTAIPAVPDGGVDVGSIQGYLATADDVDRYSFPVPAANHVFYLKVTAPKLTPPPPFRLAYRLLDPTGVPLAEGRVDNEFIPVNLATARKVSAGVHTIELFAYRPAGFTDIIPGDLRLQYTVEVRVFPEADVNEPNDTLATARGAFSFNAPGAGGSVTGRIGAVADPDWYRIDLQPSASPTVLHYRLRPSSGAGRFSPLPGPVDRQLRLMDEVDAGTNAVSRRVNCQTLQNVCPKGYGVGEPQELLVQDLCGATDPPRCLWSAREEDVVFTALRNFEGAIPVSPSAVARSFFLVVQDEGQNWADDLDYALSLDWRADPDETSRSSGGVEQSTTLPLADVSATYPRALAGASTLSGTLSHGFGRVNEHDPADGEGVRAFEDYDAVPSDIDRFTLTFPAFDPDAGPLDRAWALEWEVGHLPDAGRAHDLSMELAFCELRSDGGCRVIERASRGSPLIVSHIPGLVLPWYGPGLAEQKGAFGRAVGTGLTSVQVDPYACFCFESRFVRGGRFALDVLAVDRKDYGEVPYTVRLGYSNYPQSYAAPDGGARICPAPVALGDGGYSGGCFFTRQP